MKQIPLVLGFLWMAIGVVPANAAETEYPFVISSSNGSCLATPKDWSAEQALKDGCKLTGKKESKRGNSIIVNCTDVPKWNANGDKKRPYVWTSTKEFCEQLSKFLFKDDAMPAASKKSEETQ